MKKLAIGLIAAATLFGTAAFAQGVDVRIGGGGAGVSIGDGRGDGYRGNRRGYVRDGEFRRSRNETVIIKQRRGYRDYDRPRKRVYIVR